MNCPAFISLVIFLFGAFLSNAQSNTNSDLNDKLFYLCKAWGHAKYFHSGAAGQFNFWDNQLLIALEELKDASSDSEYDAIVFDMISGAGKPELSDAEKPELFDSLNNNRDISWISNKLFSDTTISLLEFFHTSFRGTTNHMLGNGTAPDFSTDNGGYETFGLPRMEYRLLALFRYWNIIHYFFPYKDIMDQSWDTTLREFIPRFVNTRTDLQYHLAFRELTVRINDSHGVFYSPTYQQWLGTARAPFSVKLVEGKTVVTKVADNLLPVKVGDIILEISGQSVVSLRDSLKKYAEGSNEPTIDRQINNMLCLGSPGRFEVKVDDGDVIKDITLSRHSSNTNKLYSNLSDEVWSKKEFGNGCIVGTINAGLLNDNHMNAMFEDLKDADYLIFDIRNYPEVSVSHFMRYLFFTPVHMANFAVPDFTYPGRFTWKKAIHGGGGPRIYNSGKLILLFDEWTQSAAEFSCMGIEQYSDVTKVGSTTAGADGNVSRIYLPGNIVTSATFLGVYYPDYSPTQRIGIVPDYFVKPTIRGIRAGQDEVLSFAYSLVGCAPKNLISVYPNPSRGMINYEVMNFKSYGVVIAELFDDGGKMIKKISIDLGRGSLDIAHLSSGVYMLRVTMGNDIQTIRIVKN